ncbi:MAG TPA: glycosyltransferase family 4 protein, partial [Deltaproteobacteria bacterium]|nr:glycosyltransferase family 4 protein [Deltaproteobacteria bacterium]
MRIAQVAPLIEPVPPKLYGGTERVVSYITEELVKRGHRVTLFASGDSKTKAELRSVIGKSIRLDGSNPDSFAYHTLELSDVLSLADEFDVIHCHLEYLAFPFSRLFGVPTVHTLHGKLDYPYWRPMMECYPDVPLVSISDSQRRPVSDMDVCWMDTIHHGLPESNFMLYPGEDGYLAFYSRMSPEKHPDLAIEVAKRSGIPLKMAGKVDNKDREYFKTKIKPMLDHPLVEFIGEIGEEERPVFLGNARALLFPIEWPEPFGLVMIESMAVGTPVIARPYGAVPEVIDEGVTGLIA